MLSIYRNKDTTEGARELLEHLSVLGETPTILRIVIPYLARNRAFCIFVGIGSIITHNARDHRASRSSNTMVYSFA